MEGVIDTVQKLQRAWESRRNNSRLAKAQRLFHKFCGTLNAHRLLIEVLPSGNEYVSIFTGTLNAVIQVSGTPTVKISIYYKLTHQLLFL